jgi:hypothetical protein
MVSRLPTWLLLSQEQAWEIIERETRRSRDVETGGILIGLPVNYQNVSALVVLVATGPGPKAEHGAICFAPDHQALGEELEGWRDHYDRYRADFIGIWHKHPAGVPVPTSGDLQQAQGILDDPDYVLPGKGILLPITQLKRERCALRAFYLPRGQVEPVELECLFVKGDVLEELLDEVLAVPSVDQHIPQAARRDIRSAEAAQERPASRWGELPPTPPRIPRPYDVGSEEGEIIIGEFSIVDESTPEPASAEEPDQTPPESMAWAGLKRQVQRINRMAQRYHFGMETQSSEGSTLDYVELAFNRDVYIPKLPRWRRNARPSLPGEEAEGEDDELQALPVPGEQITGIRIGFPYNYPGGTPVIWLCGERAYRVNREVLQASGADSLAQEVEDLLRWLFNERSARLPGLIEANDEYLLSHGAHLVGEKAEAAVDSMDDLVSKMENPSSI